MPKKLAPVPEDVGRPPLPAALADAPAFTIDPHDGRLPPGLQLAAPMPAVLAPDGRAIPLDLPPALLAHLFPDLYPLADPVPPPPTIAEV